MKHLFLIGWSGGIGSHHSLALLFFQKVVVKRAFLCLLFLLHSTLTTATHMDTFTFPFKDRLIAFRPNILGEHVMISLPCRVPLTNKVIFLLPILSDTHILHLKRLDCLTQ